jgi:hypothetical protein
MYRDESYVAQERVNRLRCQVATLRARTPSPDDRALCDKLRRHRREIARARRCAVRLRHPILRLRPQSLAEVAVSAGLAYAMLLTLGFVALVVSGLVGPFIH